MTSWNSQTTVGAIVAEMPALSRVFEKLGIDYCCGGKKPLTEMCEAKGLDATTVLAMLEAAVVQTTDAPVKPASLSLPELVDHIESTHHVYLKEELPRLRAMTERVASVHGESDPRLARVRELYHGLADELSAHLVKEEQMLFPMIRELAASEGVPAFHCGSIQNPIRQMEVEHEGAGEALASLRELTDGYQAPDWACNTYRAMLEGLERFEADTHQHIHKENNILHPRAVKMEAKRREAVA